MKNLLRRALISTGLMAALFAPSPLQAGTTITQDKAKAVVLAYYRIGEDVYPDSNLRTAQFQAHLSTILSGEYNVLPLPYIIETLKSGETLPPRTLAITFQGAYRSAYENAMLPLLRHNIPFTVFYATGRADKNAEQFMNWEHIKTLARHKHVSFGLLPDLYTRLSDKPEPEIRRQVNKALQKHRENLAVPAPFFSYPFGEYSLAYRNVIETLGFEAAFGLHSGAIYAGADYFALPRFTLTERYGDIERFNMVSRALPLPVTDLEPHDPYLDLQSPALGFTVDRQLEAYTGGLSCFVSGHNEPPETEIIGRRIELRANGHLPDDKFRINCTMPGPDPAPGEPQAWRWLGMLLINKPAPVIAESVSEPTSGPQTQAAPQ